MISGHHKMRTVTNLLIFNLSLTDLINTVFNSTFSYIFMKNRWDLDHNTKLTSYCNRSRNWIFGVLFCRLTAFMIKLSLHIVKCDHIGHFSLIVAPRNWVFGVLFCRLTAFMTHLSIVASVLTMAAIAGERLPSWFVTFWWNYLEENFLADTWSRRSHADLILMKILQIHDHLIK